MGKMAERKSVLVCADSTKSNQETYLGVEEDLVLAGAPRRLLDRGIEVVEPALATLLTEPPGKTLSHIAPLENLG